ncbi:hypothetical protein AN643_02975, partial [Candidatus Epulonipiscioides saccharophilum]
SELELLMDQARELNIDVKREETTVWMAYEFLKFADYDEAHPDDIKMLFEKNMRFNNKKNIVNGLEDVDYWVENLADFERSEVIEMLDKSIATLKDVIAGKIIRADVRTVDWDNITVDKENGNFLNPDGKPIFIYDYFSKAQQEPKSDPYLYNDHIGNVTSSVALNLGLFASNLDVSNTIEGKMTLEENLNLLKENGYSLFTAKYKDEILGFETTFPRKKGSIIDPILYTNHYGKPMLYNKLDNIGYLMLWHSGGGYQDWFLDKNNRNTDSILSKEEGAAGISKYTTYDIDQPALKDAWKVLLDDVVPQKQGDNSIKLGYILTNEPHWYTDVRIGKFFMVSGGISNATLNKFREYLRAEYDNNINKLKDAWNGVDNSINKIWGGMSAAENNIGDSSKLIDLSTITSFEEIVFGIPFDGSLIQGTVQHYDWCKFNMERVTEWFSFLNNTILENDPTAGTHLKLFPRIFTDADGSRDHGMDLETLSRMTTYLGNDVTIRKEYYENMQQNEKDDWAEDYAYYWREVGLMYDLSNSFSPTQKVNVNSEGHAIQINSNRDIHMDPEYVRSAYFLSAILGEDANLTWFWPRKSDGSPENTMRSDVSRRDTYPGSVINMPQVANEITQTFLDLNAHSVAIAKMQNLGRPARIFYSETSNIYDSNQVNLLFDMYESINFHGVPIGFNTMNIMNDKLAGTYPQEFDVTVIYKTPYVTDSEYESILNFAKSGHQIILDDESLLYDQFGYQRDLSDLYSIPNVMRRNGLEELGNNAMKIVKDSGHFPAVMLAGDLPKGLIWRVVPSENIGEYTVAIVNVSKHEVSFDLAVPSVRDFYAVDLLTGQKLGTELTMKPEAVYLLNIAGTK